MDGGSGKIGKIGIEICARTKAFVVPCSGVHQNEVDRLLLCERTRENEDKSRGPLAALLLLLVVVLVVSSH